MPATTPVTPDSLVGRRDAPLIPEFLWRWVGLVIGALAVMVVGLALLTSSKIGPFAAEQRVIDALRDSWVPRRVWRFGLALGGARFFGVVVVALAVWAIVRRSWPALVACATVPGAVLVVEQILKPIVHRQDQWHDALYYPSGTAAGVAAWATLVWLLAVPLLSSSRWRVALAVGLGALTALTALAVIASDKHLPLDAVGGIAAGMAIVLACAALIDRLTGAHRT
jgi:membrane-associated phospholipid phosphatase